MTIVLDKVVEEVATKAVNELVQIVAKNIKLIVGIDSDIVDLTSEIETFNARLLDASKIHRAKDLQVMKVIVKKFRTVVNEAQDAVAKYISEKKNHEEKTFTKYLDKVQHCGKVNVCAREIQSLKTKMNAIRQDHEKDLLSLTNYPNSDQNTESSHSSQARPIVEKDEVFGFKEDMKTIKDRLITASNNFMIIPIVGMAGTGKTTFATKIFEDPDIANKFALCIWLHVSRGFNRKQKFIDIIHRIKKSTEDYSSAHDDLLADEILSLLKKQKYFIVLDDVWEEKDWNSLKVAFPENLNGSRVLVTTRRGSVIDSKWEPHTLKKLDNDESWSLLKKNVFGGKECDKLFERHGRKIAENCRGLPLALRVIAGILCKNRTVTEWERVAENPFLEINREGQSYHELVLLSYEQLPHENLKNCFLYFASFPMGYEIAVWKLIRLWIAEELIPTIDEWGYHLDMEIEAHKYLNDFVDMNLVKVMSRKVNGQIKTCRIYDSLHEFCKSEAARKNLFRVMDEGQRLDANATSSRRLCFYSSIAKVLDAESNPSYSFISCCNKKRGTCPSAQHVHTLLLSPLQKGEIQLTQQLLTVIPITFPLLRVLDIESLKFESIPDEIYDLHLLRYLAITADLDLLPRQFRKLRELETIVFRTKQHALKIAGGIWNMEKLRHVHTNTSAQLPPLLEKIGSTNNIRTLSTISPACCREEIMSKTPKLQKLGIRGNLEELLETKEGTCLFNNLQMLDCLENLKLYGVCDKELKVPKREKFPGRLRSLTLSNTFFHWDDMSILGSLEKLEMLKLDESAFKGEIWDLKSNVVFKQLRYLRIVKTNLETWIASEHSFPVLETLVIRNCLYLERIPNAFAEVNSLKVMELYHVSEKATKSAKEVHHKRHNRGFEFFITSFLSQATVHQQRHGPENVKLSGFDFFVTSFLSQPTVDQQSHGKENVKTSGFELFITALPSQATVHKQTGSGFDLPSTSLSSQEIASTVDEFVVGLDGEVETIMGRIIEGSKNLKVISIVGMMGLGKTTLSNRLLNEYQLQYEFFTRFLIDVLKKNDTKEIFCEILKMLTNEENAYDKMLDEVQLVDKIKELLEGKKYFIVMDGVRTMQEWNSLKDAFPDNMRGSRVLVTTRNHEVAFCADSACNPHQLKFLTSDEIWGLLAKKVFGKEICSDESLETLGRRIATKCNGIPRVAEVIADELCKNRTSDRWKHLADDPFAIIDHMNQECNPLIQLVYDKMNFQLRNCFLYLAAFPIGYEIVARKLIHLWIAEGFIQLLDGENSLNLECTAEECLNDLIDRKLLTVSERSADGQIKKCSIHKTLHEFCKTEAAKKNVFHKMDTVELVANKYIPRRLSVDSSALDFQELGSKVSTRHVRSFISSCSEEEEVLNEPVLAAIAKSFPLLRVMDVESLKFKSLPKELCFLHYLKYLALAVSTEPKFPPKLFNNLWEMQTLVLNSSQSSVAMEVEIWSMPKLRHVYSNTPMQLSPPSTLRKNSSGSMDLQTLSNISPSSCTGEIFEMIPNLQKLGIRGNLGELMANNGGIEFFDNLEKLSHLQNLKLHNSANDSQTGRLQSIPQHKKFPNRLRKLSLSNTSFGWKDMRVLGALDELQVLKLKDNAFKGKSWELDDNIVFKQLQFLRIVKADLESWKTSKSCFPVLKTLIIKHCSSLEAVPSEFAGVDSLKLLDLYCTTEMAANAARRIEEIKRDNGNAESCGFKLCIYPEHY
nr:putative late blight resistance protein homolog R1B-8 [Ipomoea batatas]